MFPFPSSLWILCSFFELPHLSVMCLSYVRGHPFSPQQGDQPLCAWRGPCDSGRQDCFAGEASPPSRPLTAGKAETTVSCCKSMQMSSSKMVALSPAAIYLPTPLCLTVLAVPLCYFGEGLGSECTQTCVPGSQGSQCSPWDCMALRPTFCATSCLLVPGLP